MQPLVDPDPTTCVLNHDFLGRHLHILFQLFIVLLLDLLCFYPSKL